MKPIYKVLLKFACLGIMLSSPLQAQLNETFAVMPTPQAGNLLIEPVTVLSPELDGELPNQQVLIRNGIIVRLAEAGSALTASELLGVVKLNGQNLYLTPGLMDSHVHVSDAPGLLPARADNYLPEFFRQQPRSYLYFGVTQLLDLSSNPQGIEVFKQQPQAPDLWHCGAAPVAGGYGNPRSAHPNFIHQHSAEKTSPEEQANTPATVVKRIADRGAHCLKIFIEDGFGDSNHLPLYSKETLAEIRKQASHYQLPLFAHANAYDMQQIALESKVDVLAHGLWNWTGMTITEQERKMAMLPSALAEHLQQIKLADVGYQPTLSVMTRLAAMLDADVLTDPQLQHVVPPALLNWYQLEEAQWFKRELLADFGGLTASDAAARLRAIGQRGALAAKTLHQLGHPLLLASDTPSAPAYSHQPGYSTYLELTEMAAAGISLQAIFEAATINNARLLQLDEQYGTVSVGKVANLLLLKHNPLQHVEAWDSIETVILHGRPIARQSLSARDRFNNATDRQ
ncbi:amidohydrolase family protein [Rheinheimera sp. NSM]|uniref:amidohydrolase family protein n=1 Tax=Rheinheimera sp. NSM TaxID=3457884 RepID=UPI00403671D2